MSAEFQMVGVKARLAHELKAYAATSLYLYVCFSALLLYKAAVLEDIGIGYAPFGLAAVKSLILGKFMLIGHAVHVGETRRPRPLIHSVLRQSLAFLVMLLVLVTLEEIVVGAIHGMTVRESFGHFTHRRLPELGATMLVMWLILLSYFAARYVRAVVGPEAWRRMLYHAP